MRRRSSATPDAATATADALHSAAIHLLRRVRREDARTGLGPARLSALSVIVFGGPVRISDLARAEQVRVPTMTPIVAALERAGLVRRERDALDARAVRLHATPRGRRLMLEGRRRRVTRLAADIGSVPPGDRETLARAAAILLRLFAPHAAPPPAARRRGRRGTLRSANVIVTAGNLP